MTNITAGHLVTLHKGGMGVYLKVTNGDWGSNILLTENSSWNWSEIFGQKMSEIFTWKMSQK